jgi:hypothetical protein
MNKAEMLRMAYEANIACGDVDEAEELKMLAEIAAAEAENPNEDQPSAT